MVQELLQVEGMTCASCELRIENRLNAIAGVRAVKASFGGATVRLDYEPDSVSRQEIVSALEELDYHLKQEEGTRRGGTSATDGKLSINQGLGIGIIILAVYLIIKNTIGFNFIPDIDQNMGYGLLFVIGLITSVHCIAMCGGINLSQCIKHRTGEATAEGLARFKPSIKYNAGRVLSYTVIGGLVGALGSVVSFSGTAKGIVAVLSGVFMVVMGVNMLGIFPWLRRFNPRMPKLFGNSIHSNSGRNGPFFVGMLNGLMPCGPLQAMQIYALGTGSLIAGATSMFFFSLGTVPLMFGLGAISSYLSGKFTHRLMKVSAALVIALGVVMFNRGLNLSGLAYATSAGQVAEVAGDVQLVTTNLRSGRYEAIVVQQGIPVRWTIKAESDALNGCNEALTIPKYGIDKQLVAGDNVIEFTPDQLGNVSYTCWMGMISSNIRVVADIAQVTAADIAQADSATDSGGAGGCCGAGPVQLADGIIPTDLIEIAEIRDGQQSMTVTVNSLGYSPAVVVLQRGVPTRIEFITEQLNVCNGTIVFPELQEQISLYAEATALTITPEQDFSFQCGMAMLRGYVKVADDLGAVDLDEVSLEVQSYWDEAGSAGGCCGA